MPSRVGMGTVFFSVQSSPLVPLLWTGVRGLRAFSWALTDRLVSQSQNSLGQDPCSMVSSLECGCRHLSEYNVCLRNLIMGGDLPLLTRGKLYFILFRILDNSTE